MRLAARTAVLFIIASLYASPAIANKLIAVLPLDVSHAKKLDPDAQASLEEMLRDVATNALSDEGWTVLATQNMLQTLRDNGVDPSKCGEEECQVATARELKAEKFISGAVQWVEGEYTASIRLIDTSTGRILSSARLEGESVKSLRRAFEQQAQEFFVRGQMLQRGAATPPPAPLPKETPPSAPAPKETPAPPEPPVASRTPPAPPMPPATGDAANKRVDTWLRVGLFLSPIRAPNTYESSNGLFIDGGLFLDWRPLRYLGVAASGGVAGTGGVDGVAYGGELAIRGYVFENLYVAPAFGYFIGKTKATAPLNRVLSVSWQFVAGAVGYVFRLGWFSLGLEARGGIGFTKATAELPPYSTSTSGPVFGGSLMPAIAF